MSFHYSKNITKEWFKRKTDYSLRIIRLRHHWLLRDYFPRIKAIYYCNGCFLEAHDLQNIGGLKKSSKKRFSNGMPASTLIITNLQD